VRRLVHIAVVLSGIAVSSTIAIADGDDLKDLPPQVRDQAMKLGADAREHFVAGYRAFTAKDYKTASGEFELAYKLSPEVPLLFTWAQSERLGHNCPHAIELYEKYLYSDINDEQADYARRWIKECGGHTGSGSGSAGSGSTGSGAGSGSGSGSAIVHAGSGSDTGIGSAHPPEAYVFYRDYLGDALVASGLLGLVAGTIYYAHSRSDADAADSMKHPGLHLDEYNKLAANATHELHVSEFANIAGGLLAAAGIGVYIYHWKMHERVTVTTDGTSVSVATKF
jgi:hypothetical protein